MKVVELGKTDIEKFARTASKVEFPKKNLVEFDRDSTEVDGIDFAVAKPKGSTEPFTEVYMLRLTANRVHYSFIVRQTRAGAVNVSLSTIAPRGSDSAKAEIATYSVTGRTVTRMKGVLPVSPEEVPLDIESMGAEGGKAMAELLSKLEPA